MRGKGRRCFLRAAVNPLMDLFIRSAADWVRLSMHMLYRCGAYSPHVPVGHWAEADPEACAKVDEMPTGLCPAAHLD
jgi:hypothetical protein